MSNKIFLFLSFVLAVVTFSCDGEGSGGLTIKGSIQNAGNMQAYLDKSGINPASANLVVGKADADGSGNFTMTFSEAMEPGIYRLRVGEQKINLILDGTEDEITVKGDLATLNRFQYDVEGSEGSEAYLNIFQQFIAKQPTPDDLRTFVDTTANPMVAMFVAVQALQNNTNFIDIHQKAAQRVEQKYPGSSYSQDYKAYLTAIQSAAANPTGGRDQYMFIEEAERKPAPEIKLPSPSGKEYALSDLKGQVVLLDFWASWCRPCRFENPNVVKIYNKYKDKGFTVFSVSLDGVDSRQAAAMAGNSGQLKEMQDRAKDAWKNAIQQDGLTWNYHVSDLKKWECEPARLYGVSSIPRTFMIDKEGRIAAVNIRGAELIEETLQKLL